jgi:hypothetical protein
MNLLEQWKNMRLRTRLIWIGLFAAGIVALVLALTFPIGNNSSVPKPHIIGMGTTSSENTPTITGTATASPEMVPTPTTTANNTAWVSAETETDGIGNNKTETVSVWIETDPHSNGGLQFDFGSTNEENIFGVAPKLSGSWTAVEETGSIESGTWTFAYPGGSVIVSRDANGMPKFVIKTDNSKASAASSDSACIGSYDWDGLSGGQQLIVNGKTTYDVMLSEKNRQDVEFDGQLNSVPTSGGFTADGLPWMSGKVNGTSVKVTADPTDADGTWGKQQLAAC